MKPVPCQELAVALAGLDLDLKSVRAATLVLEDRVMDERADGQEVVRVAAEGSALLEDAPAESLTFGVDLAAEAVYVPGTRAMKTRARKMTEASSAVPSRRKVGREVRS